MDYIPPPWIEYPDTDPWWGGWRQGCSEAWLRQVWLPFWVGLTASERDAYLELWPPPDEDWRMYVSRFWS